MLKREFFTLKKPRIFYQPLVPPNAPVKALPLPQRICLICEEAYDPYDRHRPTRIQVGDTVKAGQYLQLYEDGKAGVTATAAGTISCIAPYVSETGDAFAAIHIDVAEAQESDDAFARAAADPSRPDFNAYLAHLPGLFPIQTLTDPERSIETLVICGADCDLMVDTRKHIVKTRIEALTEGIRRLKDLTGIERVVLAVLRDDIQGLGHIGAELKGVSPEYPAAFPEMIMRDLFGRTVPAEKSCEDLGFCFVSAEAVLALGQALKEGRLPERKILTLVDKSGKPRMVSAVIGTPIRDVLAACGIFLNEYDRIILGGLMTGAAVFSEDQPVQAGTDAILVQDSHDISRVSDSPCINCGDCVRICPAGIQVNMLVRFLEAGKYEEGADLYDLHSCIACGLCSFVCVARMPIFQYIMLAKNELARTQSAEAANE